MKRYHPHARLRRRRSRRRSALPSLLQGAQDAAALLNQRGQLVAVNAKAEALLSLSASYLKGRFWTEFVDTPVDFTRIHRGPQPRGQYVSLRRSFPASLPVSLHTSQNGQLAGQQVLEWSLTRNIMPRRHLIIFREIGDRITQTEAALVQKQQQLALFSEVTLKIRQSLQLDEILRTTVTEVQRVLRADRVLVYQVLPDGTGLPISEAVLPQYPKILGMQFPEEVFPTEYQERYAQGRVVAIANVRDPVAGLAECLVEFVEQFDIKAKLIVPIVQSRVQSRPPGLWGLLIAHQCSEYRQWTDTELALMQQLADQISIALAQSQLVENLEDIVAVRTEALQQQEEQLRLITNALPVLIGYIDREQHYRFNNQAYEDWLGQSLKSIEGKHLREVWGAETYRRMQLPVQKVLAGEAVSYENVMIDTDGQVRSLNVTYVPDVDAEGEVQGFFALTSDISDRKAIERMKDEFISVVSHELRTPLTSMHSALKILSTGRLGVLSQDGQQMLEIADENTERLVRLVNNVLDLQRIESGDVTMELQTCDAASLIIRAIEAMQPMAQQQGVILLSQPEPLAIWADADYVLQALTNLLSNGIKFSGAGETVAITVEAQADHILFRIRDQGPGIPEDKLDSIFERFQQVDSSDARRKGGTGLGLTICREIIEQHGGRLWAESRLGEGSTFAFTLPVPPRSSPELPRDVASDRSRASLSTAGLSTAGLSTAGLPTAGQSTAGGSEAGQSGESFTPMVREQQE